MVVKPAAFLQLLLLLLYCAQGLRLSSQGDDEPPVSQEAQLEDRFSATKECLSVYANSLDKIKPGLGEAMRGVNLTKQYINERKLIFSAGPGSTGTRSLAAALEMLGMHGRHYDTWHHWERGIMSIFKTQNQKQCHARYQEYNYSSLTDDVEFVVDTPVDSVFIHLFAAFPNAKFVLTMRPSMDWAISRLKDGHTHSPPPMQEPCDSKITKFGKNQSAAIMDLNNYFVRCVVPKERLLEINVFTEKEDRMRGFMKELADFVGVPYDGHTKFPGTHFSEEDDAEPSEDGKKLMMKKSAKKLKKSAKKDTHHDAEYEKEASEDGKKVHRKKVA